MSKVDSYFEIADKILDENGDLEALRMRQRKLLASATDEDLEEIVRRGNELNRGYNYRLEDLRDSRDYFRRLFGNPPDLPQFMN